MSVMHEVVRSAGIFLAATVIVAGCAGPSAPAGTGVRQAESDGLHRFVVLDPGHFHAALVFKPAGYKGVSPLVGIYAPVGDDYVDHMARVTPFNTRPDDPAGWKYKSYLGPDFDKVIFEEAFGNIAVLSGKNQPKIDRILDCVRHDMNVLADKPWVIDPAKLPVLDEVLGVADEKGLVVYDIMTGRYEITNVIQRHLIQDRRVFGELIPGTPEEPAVVKKSVHYLYKTVAGLPLVRPWWFFDVDVQGEGLVDVTTHLVDNTFWCLFPEEPIDYRSEISMLSADHWPTLMSVEQFGRITGKSVFPPQFRLDAQGRLPYYCNGNMTFSVRGINAMLQVEWNYEAPPGGGDTHYSVVRGSQAHVMILQDKEQNYRAEVYVEPAPGADRAALGRALVASVARLAAENYSGLEVVEEGGRWRIVAPDALRDGHEAHFGRVTDSFLRYIGEETIPAWERANMMAKYYVTTSALEMARKK